MISLKKQGEIFQDSWNDNPSEKILQKMEFFDDQEGILRRYLYEKENWNEHLTYSKDFIIQFIEYINPQKIAILGSGWLLDVPLDYLINNCSKIYLVDIRHPKQIIQKYRNQDKIHFIKSDITGGAIEAVYNIMKISEDISKDLENLKPPGINFLPNIDCYISLNILCQLDILILEYIRKYKNITQASIETFRKNIQHSHIASLKKSKFCLITDYTELVYSRTDDLVNENLLLFSELPISKYYNEWIWRFDTQMTYYPNRKTYFKVKAIYN